MARLSFEKKRAPQPVAHPAAVAVRVFGAGDASVGGTSVMAAPGEDIQQAVLNHLQRLAISLGAPIHATIQDDVAGCVVPLEVSADGSSRVAGEPTRVAPPVRPQEPTEESAPAPAPAAPAPVKPAPAPAAPAPVKSAPAPAAPAPAPAVPEAESVLPDYTTTHTPPRGFDAVAEEMLGDGPLTETAEGAELLGEPIARINEAVREGRIELAVDLVDRTVEEATAALGPHHAEVLHLRELTAYIAYLAGDPVRAFRLSLDLARQRRQTRDAEAAYGNVQSAAMAWRAVRDPEVGLRLGHDLIDLWTHLAAEPGPAAEDPHPLDSARARMLRLTDRAARL
ncbi:tetratricopeptide repeat protein [Streptomyces sp. NPDC127190]|uniref:tetratricopeptide repeat protein n=1 Tax=unclassified Streptomyces TaxID=2593676 RepID=UPI0036394933